MPHKVLATSHSGRQLFTVVFEALLWLLCLQGCTQESLLRSHCSGHHPDRSEYKLRSLSASTRAKADGLRSRASVGLIFATVAAAAVLWDSDVRRHSTECAQPKRKASRQSTAILARSCKIRIAPVDFLPVDPPLSLVLLASSKVSSIDA